jgi:hypothetical protein
MRGFVSGRPGRHTFVAGRSKLLLARACENDDIEERSVFCDLGRPVAQNRHAALLGVSLTPSGPRQQSAASASENQETGGVAHYGNVSFAWGDVF